MPKLKHAHIVVCLAIVWGALPALTGARLPPHPCTDARSQQAWDKDPVHADAVELEHLLSQHGFVIDCIRSSKEQRRFSGERGAAWFKTDRGTFDVLFLPKGQNFDTLQVIEQPKQSGRYLYSFQGAPHIQGVEDSSRRMWFIKHKNMLFSVWGDEQLALALQRAFHEQ
jgi:hypothetical protein